MSLKPFYVAFVLLALCVAGIAAQVVPKKAAEPNDVTCQVCEVLVFVAEIYVDYSHMTADEIVDELNNLCELLPAETVVCKGIVTVYGKKIANDLVAGKTPDEICHQDTPLCDEEGFQRVLPQAKAMSMAIARAYVAQKHGIQSESEACDICKLLVGLIEQYLDDGKTVDDIEKLLDQVCDILGPLSDTCKAFVDEYVPQIVDLLINEFPPERVCGAIGACDEAKRKEEPPRRPSKRPASRSMQQAESGDSLSCTGCKFIVGQVERIIDDDASKEQIKKAFEEVCKILPGSLKDECDELVDEYLDQIIDLLISKEPPEKVCKQIGLCDKFRRLFERAAYGDGFECAGCKFLVEKLEEAITSNSTEREILKLADQICNLLPAPLDDVCTTFAADNLIALLEALIEKENPDVVCHQLGACTSLLRGKAKGAITCIICEEVMNLAKTKLADDATEEQITRVVEHVCDPLPGEISSVCHDFVETYGPEIIKSLAMHIDPKQACTFMHVCEDAAAYHAFILTQPH